MSTGIIYGYYSVILKVDEEEFGGHGALLQEGLFASITLFLVFSLYHSINCRKFLCAKKQKLLGFTVPQSELAFLQCAAFLDCSLQFSTLLIGVKLEVLPISLNVCDI
jgi:hypothetical protein